MELTEIRTGIFGYNKGDMCRYISEINEIHAAQLDAVSSELETAKNDFDKKIKKLENQNSEEIAKNSALSEEAEKLSKELEARIKINNELMQKIEKLEEESRVYHEKAEVISTAIIKAEKCAGAVIDEANLKADNLISDALSKVEVQTRRMAAAKAYIAELRASLADTLKKLDNELADAERNIENKKTFIDVNNFNVKSSDSNISEETANSAREKFGIFRRA